VTLIWNNKHKHYQILPKETVFSIQDQLFTQWLTIGNYARFMYKAQLHYLKIALKAISAQEQNEREKR